MHQASLIDKEYEGLNGEHDLDLEESIVNAMAVWWCRQHDWRRVTGTNYIRV